jgi:Cutinase
LAACRRSGEAARPCPIHGRDPRAIIPAPLTPATRRRRLRGSRDPAQAVDVLYAGLDSIKAKDAADYGRKVRAVALKNLDHYLAGKQQGVTELLNVFARQHKACPNSKFLLAGFSQGAMIVHEFLNLRAGKKDRSADNATLGAVLIADPERVANSKVTEVADAAAGGKGVCVVANAALGLRCLPQQGLVPDVGSPFASRTLGVCSALDPVCDTSSLLSAAVQAWAVGQQQSAEHFVKNVLGFHVNGYGTLQATKIAGGVLGTRLKNS